MLVYVCPLYFIRNQSNLEMCTILEFRGSLLELHSCAVPLLRRETRVVGDGDTEAPCFSLQTRVALLQIQASFFYFSFSLVMI
jgi:hypothetical protein